MDKTRLEITVGFFVLLALAIFFVIVFFVSGVYFLREGYQINAHFNYTAGIGQGAQVRMLGVRVGEIQNVKIEYDKKTGAPLAVVSVWLEKGTEVYEDAEVLIVGTFALNETHIEIFSSGSPDKRLLKDGDMIVGVDPAPMEKIMERGVLITETLGEIAEQLNVVLADEKMQKAVQSTILDMSQVLEYMNRMIKNKDAEIQNVVDNMDSTLGRLSNILATIDNGEGTLGKLVNDDELYQEISQFIEDVDKETKELIREIKLHPWRLMKKDKKRNKKKDKEEE